MEESMETEGRNCHFCVICCLRHILLVIPVVIRFMVLTEEARELDRDDDYYGGLYDWPMREFIVINGIFAVGGDTMFDMYSLAVLHVGNHICLHSQVSLVAPGRCFWCMHVPASMRWKDSLGDLSLSKIPVVKDLSGEKLKEWCSERCTQHSDTWMEAPGVQRFSTACAVSESKNI